MDQFAYKERQQQEYHRRETNILVLIIREAEKGNLYLPKLFCQRFEGVWGLGSWRCIEKSLNKLIEQGVVKFNQDYFKQTEGYRPHKYGALCVDGMLIPSGEEIDPENGKKKSTLKPRRPTHFKDYFSGAILPIENDKPWSYMEFVA